MSDLEWNKYYHTDCWVNAFCRKNKQNKFVIIALKGSKNRMHIKCGA